MKTLDSLWSHLLVGSIHASLLIVVVFLLRTLLRGRVPAQCFHLLWLLVALRLLIPSTPSSGFSIFNLLPSTTDPASADVAPWHVRFSEATPSPSAGTDSAHWTQARQPQTASFTFAQAIPLVWLLGVGIQSALLALSAVCMRRALTGSPVSRDLRLTALAAECASVFGVSGKLKIIESDVVTGPALMGLWRPKLLLPPGFAAGLSDEELRFVLMHETAHLRRRDLAALWLMRSGRILHWFNPLVWLAARVARTDTELACDEAVLRNTRPDRSVAYGETLLKLVRIVAMRSPSLPTVGIVESRRAMHVRLKRIALFRENRGRNQWLAALSVVSVGVCFGADEKAVSPSQPGSKSESEQAEWVKGWSVVGVSFSPDESIAMAQVVLLKPDGAGLTLRVGEKSADGVTLVSVGWTEPAEETALITLEKAGVKATLTASREIVSRSAEAAPQTPQITIQARFLEISEIAARRLSGSADGRDRTGIELLGERLKGAPIVKIVTEAQSRDFLRSIAQTKDVDLLSAPQVTTKSGQRALIEVIHEFIYPSEYESTPDVSGGWTPKAFEIRNCGVTFEVVPQLDETGAIALKIAPQVVEFLGFLEIDTKKKYPAKTDAAKRLSGNGALSTAIGQKVPVRSSGRVSPVFSSRKMATDVSLQDGQSVLIVGIGETENVEGFPSRANSQRLAVLVSASLVNPPAARNPEAKSPEELAPAETADLPLPKGIPVLDRPGFVRSPFAPKDGFIDVRGLPPGTTVLCPYSKKKFILP